MPEAINRFLDQLGSSFAATVSQLMSCDATHSIEPEPDISSRELWCTAKTHAGAGQLAIATTRAVGLLLARAMLSEQPGEGAEFTDEDQELLVEFWKQILGRATTDLKSLLNDTSLEYTSAQRPDWKPATTVNITVKSERTNLSFGVGLSSELVLHLTAEGSAAVVSDTVADSTEVNNLDLLLDVPLAVTLRFGKRPMPLRDILQLTSGSVVELDRQAEDAVDLLLDERLIARGQVVVVDGCYGLRVTEVVR